MDLSEGARGPAVRDLQRRLAAAGFTGGLRESPSFGPSTAEALRAFQRSRGLPDSGRCDDATWAALVEAGYRLGDRLLYLRAPMMRGDDVAELQRRLGALGFDAGKVDGIFGPLTEAAVTEFQRNLGLVEDGCFGPRSVVALQRIAPSVSDAATITTVREREVWLRSPRTLAERRVVVGSFGDAHALARAMVRDLRNRGAWALAVDDPDPAAHAELANRFDAELWVGLVIERRARIAYYGRDGYESIGGRAFATALAAEVAALLDHPSPEAMRLPVLTATRMPAVLLSLPVGIDLARRAPELRHGMVRAVAAWFTDPHHLVEP